MGTSISAHSPRELNWNPVLVCYKDSRVPVHRVISEIWRAADNQTDSISDHMGSVSVFECYKSIKSSETYEEAIEKVTNFTIESGRNSLVVELAKRALAKSYSTSQPIKHWKSFFVSEVTSYFVSRDASGFIGPNYRNKNIRDLIAFKKDIDDRVVNIVSKQKSDINNLAEWKQEIQDVVTKLKDYGIE